MEFRFGEHVHEPFEGVHELDVRLDPGREVGRAVRDMEARCVRDGAAADALERCVVSCRSERFVPENQRGVDARDCRRCEGVRGSKHERLRGIPEMIGR